ncbi:MAG: hypothetical protein FD165_2607 [Gammaproteobacteria bacterium]|nr:MAG: hypothetical protein FD165_2607 [Gammaproteobacteria bacterium]TND01498.1 MAG: hypothetical protein FD120_2568 [Gammaproteobacteria bacterium]
MGKKKAGAVHAARSGAKTGYTAFAAIDGRHPYRDAVPNGYVDYFVRTRHQGEVFYLNFDLAKEMGLLPSDHRHVLSRELSDVLLQTFGLQIINEYDIIHNTPVDDQDIRSRRYMATRYLQPQHPGRLGKTSGDGRSIWNGCFSCRGVTWDISSCGTGATCLSPATANQKRFFQTGDPSVSYGCGQADLLEGVSAALMSEIMHRNGIATERTLAIVAYPDGTAVNVRAARSLLRPAHFFACLKQGNIAALKNAVDFYIERRVSNGEWPRMNSPAAKYQHFLEAVCHRFAQAAAVFESEYIFCWLDWDGDNILCDAGIIDYGSLRQFGLYHHEYRYDDVDRYSTTITEQRNKARYIVQTFAQMVDFLITGNKKRIREFGRHRILQEFDAVFERTKNLALLYKTGADRRLCERMMADGTAAAASQAFRKVFSFFERAKSCRGPREVMDGITWDAIYCMRDVLRELPGIYLANDVKPVDADVFMEIMASNYTDLQDRQITAWRRRRIREFQRCYLNLVARMANLSRVSAREMLQRLAVRVQVINRYDRITGDGVIAVAEVLLAQHKNLGADEIHRMIDEFVSDQVLQPEFVPPLPRPRSVPRGRMATALARLRRLVREYREGL